MASFSRAQHPLQVSQLLHRFWQTTLNKLLAEVFLAQCPLNPFRITRSHEFLFLAWKDSFQLSTLCVGCSRVLRLVICSWRRQAPDPMMALILPNRCRECNYCSHNYYSSQCTVGCWVHILPNASLEKWLQSRAAMKKALGGISRCYEE